ncbi:MAG TPA: hypothetical protein PKO06_02030, partial [Candidatus Ozemobacteraceae bacterium]|nr:hypothetical protein [Candidatus Ozemobacteraceae bacterium]
ERPSKPPVAQPAVTATASTRHVVGSCPLCGEGRIVKGNSAYGCLRFREGCQFRLPFEYLGKTLSEAMVKQLLNGKETRASVGFTSPDGTKQSGKLRLNKTTREIELVPIDQTSSTGTTRSRKKKEKEET